MGKPFLLHSCGCIFKVMDDLIAARIDAKHSNEDAIAPYGRRIGNFGGLSAPPAALMWFPILPVFLGLLKPRAAARGLR
ncbi:MAG: hypothetical protein LBL76_05370 [Treponema sp.]|nr:hypothetical protein [Treponema sp.]